MTHEREATLVGQVKEPERRVNRTGHLVHFERTPGPCPGPWLSTARDYIDRKRAEHKTKREARRAHKRHLANVIRRMWADHARRHATVAEPLTAAAA